MNHITDDDLIDYLHRECADSADARIHAHLIGCRDCRERHDAEAALGDALRAFAHDDERELPAGVRAEVWAAIRGAQPSFAERLTTWLRPAFALPVAAVIAVLLFLGVPIVRADHAAESPTVAAAYYLEEHAAEALETPLADRVNTNATLALESAPSSATAPLIDAADAATLDDVVATHH
jgi:predicted anti-sigma-YlaC factor YlaD